MSKPRLVTLPLDTIVLDLLADFDCRAISPEVAEILHLVTDNKATYHIQFPGHDEVDINGTPLDGPRLWSLRHWKYAAERNTKIKLRGIRDRETWIIREANIKLIAKCLVKMCALNPDAAVCIARMKLDKNDNTIKCILPPGRKLYTNVKEIP